MAPPATDDAVVPAVVEAVEYPEITLALRPPRVKEPLVETLGDVWFELRCEVDHREKPVWPP